MTETVKLPPEIGAAIKEFMRLAKDLPLSKRAEHTTELTIRGGEVACPSSGRIYDANEIEILQDQIGPIRNLLHPDLRKDMKGMCPIACIKCREVVAWLAPGKDHDGFTLEPDKIYHIHHCPQCDPQTFKGEVVTELIEKQLYLQYKHKG